MPMTQAEVDDLVAGLGKRFPGLKLTPIVTVNEELIGLAQMQEALTA